MAVLYRMYTAGGRIGVIVEAETAVVNDAVKNGFNKPCNADCSFKSEICFQR